MKTLTFGTLKGGVGKTMLTFNIGGILAHNKHKTLIIDSDLQGNLTNNIGIERACRNMPTLYDVYNIGHRQPLPENLVIKAPNNRLPYLDIIVSSIFLHKTELSIAYGANRLDILKNYINEHQRFFENYEYILIDTNPSMSVVNQNAFFFSDSIILLSDVSMNAIEGAQLFIALWEETRRIYKLPDNIRGFVINDFDIRNKLSSDFIEYIMEATELEDIRKIMLKTVIPRNVRITEAELAATPINLYDARSKGCDAIITLVNEMVEKNIL